MIQYFYKKFNFLSWRNKSSELVLFFLLLLILFIFVRLDKISLAQTKSPDAIAIRIIPNPDHYSPVIWYQKNIKLPGSPQSLLVDDYEAVRDGRTVYIHAANIKENIFYTNIYIISYNQAAEDATIDIFGQILSHWRFNNNINESGECSKSAAVSCIYNGDCPESEYCGSEKAKIIRDTKRLADLAEMKLIIDNYKSKNNNYPKLAFGSYLPNKTLSVWPSWQETLAEELKATLPYDPVNLLGVCPGYEKITCWDADAKRFADPTPADGNFNLPLGSYVYIYTVTTDGLNFNICCITESQYLVTGLNGNCLSGN